MTERVAEGLFEWAVHVLMNSLDDASPLPLCNFARFALVPGHVGVPVDVHLAAQRHGERQGPKPPRNCSVIACTSEAPTPSSGGGLV